MEETIVCSGENGSLIRCAVLERYARRNTCSFMTTRFDSLTKLYRLNTSWSPTR